MTQTITGIIPAKNEEKNIERCVKSLLWCDKIQVLCMGDDSTASIAQSLGAEVVYRNKNSDSDFVGVQENINWAIDNADTDWILRIDADEVVTDDLKDEIKTILNLQNNTIAAYGVPRNQYFLGDFLKGGDWAYDRLIRLFKKGSARYEPIVEVHEQFKVIGKTSVLKYPLLHFSHPTLNDVLRKFNIYTSMEAKMLNIPTHKAIYKIIFLPPYIFLRWYLYHKGYIDSWRGIVAGVLRGFYEFLIYSKYLSRELKK